MAKAARTISFDGHPRALRILDALPRGERSAYVCRAIEQAAGERSADVTLADLLRELQDLRLLLARTPIAAPQDAGETPPEVPAGVRGKLSRLGQ